MGEKGCRARVLRTHETDHQTPDGPGEAGLRTRMARRPQKGKVGLGEALGKFQCYLGVRRLWSKHHGTLVKWAKLQEDFCN